MHNRSKKGYTTFPTSLEEQLLCRKMVNDGGVEYEDGIPATKSQMGKYVVTFLSWAAEPEMEERKLMRFKWMFVLSLALLQAAYYQRMKWFVVKSRKLILDIVN